MARKLLKRWGCPTFWFTLGLLGLFLISVPLNLLLLSILHSTLPDHPFIVPMFTKAFVPDSLRSPGLFSCLVLGSLRMKREANLSWIDLWPVVYHGLGSIWERPRCCASQQKERSGVCSLQERGPDTGCGGSGGRLLGVASLCSFLPLPLPCCSNSSPAFSCPHLSAAPAPQLLEPSDWRLPAAGQAGFMALRQLGRKRGQRQKKWKQTKKWRTMKE